MFSKIANRFVRVHRTTIITITTSALVVFLVQVVNVKKMSLDILFPRDDGNATQQSRRVLGCDINLNLSLAWPDEEMTTSYSYNGSSACITEKKPVCIITASFAKAEGAMDKMWNVTTFAGSNSSFGYYYFSNIDRNASIYGWEGILLDSLPYRRMITQSRVPKFMSWKHPVIRQNCKTVFYLDASSRPRSAAHFVSFLHDLQGKVMNSTVGFASPFHPKRNHNVISELRDILAERKDIKRNIDNSLAWFRNQSDFHDSVPVYANTYFMYSVTSTNWHTMMDECFWKRYSLELDSWRDQPLFSYCVYHLGLKPISFKYGILGAAGLGHNGHQYGEADDK